MNLITALLALLHVLVPVYWLGGDLGAFLSGRVLGNPAHTPAQRLIALKILLNADMAPRTALICAFPTGFALAWTKGWLAVPGWTVALAWLVGLGWLAVAWAVHLRHGPGVQRFKVIDSIVRHSVLSALLVVGVGGLIGRIEMPLFIALKLLLLATGIAIGLIIRRQLAPLFPAVAALRTEGASAETDAAISAVLARTTVSVMCIWAVVLVAAFVGLATPV